MNIKIKEYESDTFLPKEIENIISNCSDNVLDVLNESDKVYLEFSKLRGDLIRWFANNSEVVK